MKKQLLVLVVLFAGLAWACGGKISVSDGDADEDAETDVAADETNDPAEDPMDDPSEDPADDPTEDPGLDPIEDPAEDVPEDSSADSPTDTGGPELPTGCTLPSIPDTGLYIYYCMELDTTAMLRIYREVDYSGGGSEPYNEITECMVNPAARDMLCNLPDYGSGSQVRYNIITTGVGDAWACATWEPTDPWSGVTNGVPLVKYNGSWIAMNDPVQHSVMPTRCFFSFNLP